MKLRNSVLMMLVITGMALAFTVQAAVPKPTANFTGIFNVSPTTGLTLDAHITLVGYQDNTTTDADTAQETIIGSELTLSGVVYQSTDASGNALFSDGTMAISDASGTFMTASIVGVKVDTMGYINPALSMNLKNIVFNASLNSRFCTEFSSALQQAGINEAGAKFTLDLMFGSFDSTAFGNAQGLVDGAPMVVIVVEPRTIGFWKQQAEQKGNGSTKYTVDELNVLINQALALDSSYAGSGGNVFNNNTTLFKSDMLSQGKRDLSGRGRQQIASLLLNLVSGRLSQSTPISLPEYTAATTVGAALTEVEQGIKSGVAAQVEDAKNIADFINNGVGIPNCSTE